jgi:uncharacterized protein YqeY
MTLKEQLQADLKDAMKSGDALKRDVLRMLDSAIKNVEIGKRSASRRNETGLTEEEILEAVTRAVKQRQDSIKQFTEGGRADLTEKEKAELDILSVYLPAQLGQEELRSIVAEVIATTGATSAGDIGKVMGQAMAKVKGKADGNVVREMALKLLENKE